jgi:heterotetrameric sarcosine oxidase delta subunit
MALLITCPNCGPRPYTEFWCAGEQSPASPEGPALAGSLVDPMADASGPDAARAAVVEFRRVWYRRNVAGLQLERWFHVAGCRRWLTLRRDTRTNTVHAID